MRAAIGIGANIGERELSVLDAFRNLDALPATSLVARSSLYETEPVDVLDEQPWYINAAAVIQTKLSPRELLNALFALETIKGRVRLKPKAARTLDLDLLLYDEKTIREFDLIVPHPRLTQRRFVLMPLAEIAPSWRHPVLGETIENLLAICPDPAEVRLITH